MIKENKQKIITIIYQELKMMVLFVGFFFMIISLNSLAPKFGLVALVTASGTSSATSTNTSTSSNNTSSNPNAVNYSYQCGTGNLAQGTNIDFGCKGDACIQGSSHPAYCSQNNSPILDIAFSIIRFLSDGVGLVVIASIIFAGIQYTTAGGDPQGINKAIKRIRSSTIALVLFIFMYAFLNYLLPSGFFKS